MIYQVLTVQKNGLSANSRPRIQFHGDWLTEMGFIPGALVQELPLPGEAVFNLYDENVHYRSLFNTTKEMGGTLIHVYNINIKTWNGPGFVTTGNHIYKSGFKLGDELIAECDYGRIRVRNVGKNMRLIHAARFVNEYTGESVPSVLLTGRWLSDFGFTPDTLVTIATVPGCITITALHKSIGYAEAVKSARQSKLNLIQVTEHKGFPRIREKRVCAARAGFALGDIFAASCEHGLIKLQKFDPVRFGF